MEGKANKPPPTKSTAQTHQVLLYRFTGQLIRISNNSLEHSSSNFYLQDKANSTNKQLNQAHGHTVGCQQLNTTPIFLSQSILFAFGKQKVAAKSSLQRASHYSWLKQHRAIIALKISFFIPLVKNKCWPNLAYRTMGQPLYWTHCKFQAGSFPTSYYFPLKTHYVMQKRAYGRAVW